MKKSVLWTAAGVVTATALWAGLSLPSKQTPALNVSAPNHMRDETQSTRKWSLAIQPISGMGGLFYSGEPTKVLLEWDGTTLVGNEHGKSTCNFGGKSRPITLQITERLEEAGNGFTSRRYKSFTHTLKPGETIQL